MIMETEISMHFNISQVITLLYQKKFSKLHQVILQQGNNYSTDMLFLACYMRDFALFLKVVNAKYAYLKTRIYTWKDVYFLKDQLDYAGRNIYHYLAWSGNYKALISSIEKYNLDLHTMQDSYGRGILHYLAWSGNYKELNCMLEKYNLKINLVQDYNGRNPMHYLAWSGNLKGVYSALEKYKLNLHAMQDCDNRSIMHFLARSGNIEGLINAIEKYNIDIYRMRDNYGTTLIHYLAWSGNYESFTFGMKKYNVKIKELTDFYNSTVIHMFARSGNAEGLIGAMAKYKVNIKKLTDNYASTPIHSLARSGNFAGLHKIIKKCHINIKKYKNQSGMTPVHYLAWSGNYVGLQKAIKKYNINIYSLTDNFGGTCLHYLGMSGNFQSICNAVDNYVIDIRNFTTNTGDTLLHYIARSGKFNTFQKVAAKYQLDVDTIIDNYGANPWHDLIKYGNYAKVLLAILKNKCDPVILWEQTDPHSRLISKYSKYWSKLNNFTPEQIGNMLRTCKYQDVFYTFLVHKLSHNQGCVNIFYRYALLDFLKYHIPSNQQWLIDFFVNSPKHVISVAHELELDLLHSLIQQICRHRPIAVTYLESLTILLQAKSNDLIKDNGHNTYEFCKIPVASLLNQYQSLSKNFYRFLNIDFIDRLKNDHLINNNIAQKALDHIVNKQVT